MSTKRNLEDIAPAVTAATTDGWQVDPLFTSARDGGAKGRRERAAVVLSKVVIVHARIVPDFAADCGRGESSANPDVKVR